jgi:hypothetical protein
VSAPPPPVPSSPPRIPPPPPPPPVVPELLEAEPVEEVAQEERPGRRKSVPPPPEADPFEDPGPTDPFADAGTDEPVLARHKNLHRYRRPLGWRFFVMVGGGMVCSWLLGVIVISWGRGVNAFVASLVGSVLGALCFGAFGAFVGGVLWLRVAQAARVAKKVGADLGQPTVKYLLAMMFAGFLLVAPVGTLAGAVGGANGTKKQKPGQRKTARESEAEDQRLWYAVLAAAGGAILGAAPGAVICLMYRRKPFEEDEPKKKVSKRSSGRRRERD